MKTIQQIHLEAIEDSEKLFLKYCSDSNLYQAIKKAFEGRVDKAGVPYIVHCVVVGCYAASLVKQLDMSMVDEDIVFAIGLLHDVYEDLPSDLATKVINQCEKTYYLNRKFPLIEHSVGILTKTKYDIYDQYIERVIKSGIYATIVKYADSSHNSMIDRYDQQYLQSIAIREYYTIMERTIRYQEVAERLYSAINEYKDKYCYKFKEK